MTFSLLNVPLNNVRQVLAVARFRSFDLSTAEGRSKERYRRAFLTMIASGFSRVVSIAAGLISVPLTLRYLGTERYGLWMTISSVIAILGFSDLGINNGLLNGISRAHGNDDRDLARQYVSSAFFLLSAIAIALGLAFAAVYHRISWGPLFRVQSPQAIAEAGTAVAIFVGCFLLNIPAGIVSRVQAGYQDGFSASLWSSLGSVLCLASLLSIIHFRGSLPFLVLAMAGVPVLALLLNGAVLFAIQRPWLLPSWAYVTTKTAKDLWRLGALFFTLQLAMAISYSSDNIVIARILGPQAVAQYAVPCKLFSLVSIVISFLVGPLWPAYGEALARQDHLWIRKTLLRSLMLAAGISVPLGTVLVIFGGRIIHVWVGPSIHTSPLLMAGLGAWSIVTAISLAFAVFCNGLSIIRFQVIVAPIGALSNITLSIYLTQRIGIPGVVYGSILSQLIILIPSVFYIRRYLRTVGTANA
ncbi:MAG TPA: oligosaccharide flippase family protein [Candidatus Acidoferrales bacterium]|jgi:O-antigen/teichoic acid export membrane protein|nr:oligosaccharide flippase family protein [Candidatus Acidoferrales bacterium]